MPTENAHLLQTGSEESLEVVGGGGRRSDFSTVGAMLRETRERYELTLRDVANALRIRVVYLHALEEGRFADLPGRPYVVGFLRSYAEYFGLDGDEVVRRYRDERAEAANPAKLVFPEPPPETKFPIGAMLAILVVVSVLGYGAWQLVGDGGTDTRPMVASVPNEMALDGDGATGPASEMAPATSLDGALVAAIDDSPPGASPPEVSTSRSLAGNIDPQVQSTDRAIGGAPEPVLGGKAVEQPLREQAREEYGPVLELSSASAASMPGDDDPLYGRDQASGGVAADTAAGMTPAQPLSPSLLGFPDAGESTVPGDLAAFEPAPANQAAASAAAAVEADATQIYGEVNTDARVVLRATEDCWIQIKDGGGSEVFTRLLRAGEIYKVPNRDDLLLRMGNAGGLEVIVDGTALPLLGARGEVMRNVSLDPVALMASL